MPMRKASKCGFTLLELSMVLIILSLMMAGLLAMLTQQSRIAQREELIRKLDAIEEGLVAYYKRSSTQALPCPADHTLTVDNAQFGTAVAAGCAAIDSSYKDVNSSRGAVPVRSIGLTDDYAFDPWGNLFTYVVGNRATLANAFINYPIGDASLDAIDAQDLDGNDLPPDKIMAIISHGPDGFCAFTANGVRKEGYSTNEQQQVNGLCDETSTYTAYTNIIHMGPNTEDITDSANRFDDVVRVYERSFFKLTDDYIIE